MKKIWIAFDVDGTLIRNDVVGVDNMLPNEDIRTLLRILRHFKNVKICVWSGGGELYARQAAKAIGVTHYVHKFASKNYKGLDQHENMVFDPDFVPDIAIDDIQECTLGMLNLIVRQK